MSRITCICTLTLLYVMSRITCMCTLTLVRDVTYDMYIYLTLSTLLVEHISSSIRINRMTTRSRWKFRICTTTNDLTLYSFLSLYIFVTWGWPTVAKTCRQPNKTDTKTVVFWRTYPLLTGYVYIASHVHMIANAKELGTTPLLKWGAPFSKSAICAISGGGSAVLKFI